MTLLVPGFPVLADDGQIKTGEFLDACDKIPEFFDLIGGAVFKPVKNDVQGNITKVRKRFLENPIKMATIEELILFEKTETDKSTKEKDGSGIATNALMWLKRGLQFIAIFLEHLLNKDYDENIENLKCAAKLAYSKTLQPFHGWLIGKVVSAATNACPYRTDFIKSVASGEGVDIEKTIELMEAFLKNFKANVDQVFVLFDKHDVEKKGKV